MPSSEMRGEKKCRQFRGEQMILRKMNGLPEESMIACDIISLGLVSTSISSPVIPVNAPQ
jgi:hypothetical protein